MTDDDCNDCDTPPTAPQPHKGRGCGCADKPDPGVTRLYVSSGNLKRNRIEGNPVRLPAIIVENERGRTYADSVDILDAEGNVVARVIQDDDARPAVWIEPVHPVKTTVKEKP